MGRRFLDRRRSWCRPDKLLVASRHAAGIETLRVKVSGHTPVAEDEDPPARDGRGGFMRDHDDRRALLGGEFGEQSPEFGAGVRVEVAGGFIGQKKGRRVQKRSSNGDPLLLAPRQGVRAMVCTGRDSQTLEEFGAALVECAGVITREDAGELDVLASRQRGDQVELLEDDPDLLAAEERRGVLIERVDRLARDHDLASVGLVERGEEVEEGGLARARGAHDGIEARLGNVEVDAAERRDFAIPEVVGLMNVGAAEHG
jgi:hypothetical protein